MATLNAGRWRRWAVALVQHATAIMPGARSPWANAMRRELDYIADDAAAFRWALGCVAACYRIRLTHRPRWSAAAGWRQVARGGVLMLMIGLALQDHAGGQTVPLHGLVDNGRCERTGAAPEPRQRRTTRAPWTNEQAETAHSQPDCDDPHSVTSDTTKVR